MTPPVRLSPTLLALALFAAFGPASAQSVVEGSVSVGAGAVIGDRQDRSIFNQYNGLQPGSDAIGLFGADYYRRDEDKGTSVDFRASDVLNHNRELGLRWKKQGDWKFSADYRETQRLENGVVNTGLGGLGGSTPQVVALPGGVGSGSDQDLKIKRSSLGLEFSKVLSNQWQLELSARTENKDGARLWGLGMNCPSPIAPGCRPSTGTELGWATLLVPEPINANHSQLEARVSYAGERLRLSGGYYGSFYRNQNGSLNPVVPASLYNALGALLPLSTGLQPILNQPVALAPDNQAHQLDLVGSYTYSQRTLMNFKLAYSEASQHQNFAAAGLTGAPAGVADLGAKVATTLAQVGITSRPLPKLTLSGNLRYEHRDDQTPLALYGLEGASTYTNRHLPLTRMGGKAEAAYQINSDWRASMGLDLQNIDRGVFTPTSAVAGITALRQKTDETTVRGQLRHRLSEALSGAVSVESSRRDGSNWLADNSGRGVTEITDVNLAGAGFANGIFMPTLANRHRDKIKLHADWQPSEELSLQLVAETGRDSYKTPSTYGLRSSGLNQLSLDWTYALSEAWKLNGYLSHGTQQLNQSRPDAAIMAYDNRTNTLGLGFSGRATGTLEVGGMLAFIDDRSNYAQTLAASADAGSAALLAATGGLPGITFRQTSLKLFGKYTLDKQSTLRLDLIHLRTRWNDWAWNYNGTPFTFSDGSTVNASATQSVSYIGLTYIHRWP